MLSIYFSCYAETPCASFNTPNPTPLPTSKPISPPTAKPTSPLPTFHSFTCGSDSDCTSSQFCYQPVPGQKGHCGDCLLNGKGCTVDQVCRTTNCEGNAVSLPTKCYDPWNLDELCKMRLKDESAVCNLHKMECVIQKQEASVAQSTTTQKETQSATPEYAAARPTPPPTLIQSKQPISLSEVQNQFASTSQTSTQSKQKSCNICGDAQWTLSQPVHLYGNDMTCKDLGGIVLTENILEGSDRCSNFRAQFYGACCYADSYADNVGDGNFIGEQPSAPKSAPASSEPTAEADSWYEIADWSSSSSPHLTVAVSVRLFSSLLVAAGLITFLT